MPTILKLNQDLSLSRSLSLITESLGEVAAIQFKTTHARIEHNTQFFKEIAQVYHVIKLVAARRKLLEKNKHNIPKPQSKKTISLLFTSNYQFYGDLDKQLSSFFINNTAKFDTDRIVIGTTGKNYCEALGFNQNYETYIFNSDIPSRGEISHLLEKIKPYSQILIYHSKFVTILDQEAEITDLSATGTENEDLTQQIDFILEPELNKMLDFFENQMIASRLDSIFLQAQLSRTSARMVGMDQAQLNADNLIDDETSEINREKKRVQNLRILETYITIEGIKQ